MIINLVVLSGIFLVLAGALTVWVRAWRRPPYRAEDFVQASRRIMTGMAGLVWRLERDELDAREDLALPEGLTLPEWARVPGTPADSALRRECGLIRDDIRRATAFILEQASLAVRCHCNHPTFDPEIFERLRTIHKTGYSLILRARLAGLQGLDSGARSTLRAGRQFGTLCAALSELLRSRGQFG